LNLPQSSVEGVIVFGVLSEFTETNPVSSLDGHTFRLAFANMRQVTTIIPFTVNVVYSLLPCVAMFEQDNEPSVDVQSITD